MTLTQPVDSGNSGPVLLAWADLLAWASTVTPADVTVTGFAGSGHHTLTDVLGVDRYAGLGLGEASVRYLVVMNHIRLIGSEAVGLEALGLVDAAEKVQGLPFGSAYVITRHGVPLKSPVAAPDARRPQLVFWNELLERVAGVPPESVTITGEPGSGAAELTKVLGSDRHARPWTGDGLGDPTAELVIAMWQRLRSPAEAEMERLGLSDALAKVGRLTDGAAYVFTRH